MPQGSILGPLLVHIYVNDLCRVSEFFDFILFADNINLLCSGDDLQTLTTNININLSILFEWFCANKLSLNLKKTNYIQLLFHRKVKSIPFDVSLYLNDVIINRVSKCRFLGVWLDEHVSWSDHINYVLSKISKINGILSKIRFLLPKLLHLCYCDVFCPKSLSLHK